jgi:hypothetical protein
MGPKGVQKGVLRGSWCGRIGGVLAFLQRIKRALSLLYPLLVPVPLLPHLGVLVSVWISPGAAHSPGARCFASCVLHFANFAQHASVQMSS